MKRVKKPAGKHKAQVSGERWAAALEAFQQYNDARQLVRAWLMVAPPPDDEVRDELLSWLLGKLPPDPRLKASDWHVLQAARLYRKTVKEERRSGKLPRKFRLPMIERVANEYNQINKIKNDSPDRVQPRALRSYLDFEGSTYVRIRDFLRSEVRKGPPTKNEETRS